jgi:malate/lactate dehydrogenase
MFFYRLKDYVLVSKIEYKDLPGITEDEAKGSSGTIFFLNSNDPAKSRRSYCVSDPTLAFVQNEGISLLDKPPTLPAKFPDWLIDRIDKRMAVSINPRYPGWQKALCHSIPARWAINIAGLGDVGGMLLTGLRLVGGDCISRIGIWGRNQDNLKRWEYEANQVLGYNCSSPPPVYILNKDEMFDCDMFVFCISVGVPPVGQQNADVRMAQYNGNKQLIEEYARQARQAGFKGIFAVLSDPVDLLCRSALTASNKGAGDKPDYRGLAPEQIRGYGLGVMHARAVYYASKNPHLAHYTVEGRAFGPHGDGLIIADSIVNYDQAKSEELTRMAKDANLQVRATGYKPYIAPALSSGSLSLLATIKGQWHYSATFIGGVYFGCKNRLTSSGTELERLNLPARLVERLEKTYAKLGEMQ